MYLVICFVNIIVIIDKTVCKWFLIEHLTEDIVNFGNDFSFCVVNISPARKYHRFYASKHNIT